MEAALGLAPKDKYILLVDNRQEQRLVRILDNKYHFPHAESSIGAKHQSLSNRSSSIPSSLNWKWATWN